MRRLDPREHAALGTYRMWHQKHPTKVFSMTFDFPELVGELGKALRIVYWSDKWEDKGGYFYEHDFDSRPPVFSSTDEGGVGTHRLLRTQSVHDEMQLPVLAEVHELSVDTKAGGVKTFAFKKPPVMCCTADKKTLVVLYKRDPILIRGGRMHVTERGIVN